MSSILAAGGGGGDCGVSANESVQLYTGEFDFDGIGSSSPPANTAKMATYEYLRYLSVFLLSVWQYAGVVNISKLERGRNLKIRDLLYIFLFNECLQIMQFTLSIAVFYLFC